MVSDKRLTEIINEELSKSDVNSMIDRKIDSSISSRDFQTAVKKITADVISELFKTLWQRNSSWMGSISR
jgi:hypothetical protein